MWLPNLPAAVLCALLCANFRPSCAGTLNKASGILTVKVENKSYFSVVAAKLSIAILVCAAAISAPATDLDTIGVTLLRQVDPTLDGSGVSVAQAEGEDIFTPNSAFPFEVSPVPVGQPLALFTWFSISNTAGAGTFPNNAGTESFHADSVGGNFYGIPYGVATNVSHVDNYEADYFFNSKIAPGAAIPAAVVNQSFNFDPSDQAVADPAYDNYAVMRKTIFITGAGNGGPIVSNSPATTFNGIAVGVYPGSSSFGPTSDGRSKPDIASPGSGVTSFSSPYVSGAAAILLQAARRGDGGVGTSVATNLIAIKAFLLNGAVKPADWTNGITTPLDARYGAGILNVFNSWHQLRSGLHALIESTTVGSGAAHPPGANTGNESSLTGWDYNTVSALSSQDIASHYYFNLTGSNFFTLTATLVWNRPPNKSSVNNLDLFLYNTSNGALVLSSTSAVDNVEHLFLPQLAPGRYDLQVLKRGSSQVSNGETYALAFEFFSMKLNIVLTGGNFVLSWTNAPTGFRLVSAPSLNPPVSWTSVNAISVGLNTGQSVVTVPASGTSQFFRLQRP